MCRCVCVCPCMYACLIVAQAVPCPPPPPPPVPPQAVPFLNIPIIQISSAPPPTHGGASAPPPTYRGASAAPPPTPPMHDIRTPPALFGVQRTHMPTPVHSMNITNVADVSELMNTRVFPATLMYVHDAHTHKHTHKHTRLNKSPLLNSWCCGSGIFT